MEAYFQVQSGAYKNKRFNFPASGKGHMNFTPSILKKAIFDMIESDALSGLYSIESLDFIDLFAGSGQVGIEAVSRGFRKVHFLEIDKIRFGNLKNLTSSLSLDSIHIHNKDGFRFYDQLEEGESGIVFLDPPYSFWKGEKMNGLLEKIVEVEKMVRVFIQSPECIDPNKSRRFGSNFLTEIKG